jgi:hypothetical protein
VSINVNKQNLRGMTPVFTAVATAQHECLNMLLESGANCLIAAQSGATPLFVAVCRGDVAMVDRLLLAGAVVMAKPLFLPLSNLKQDQPSDNLDRNVHAVCHATEAVKEAETAKHNRDEGRHDEDSQSGCRRNADAQDKKKLAKVIEENETQVCNVWWKSEVACWDIGVAAFMADFDNLIHLLKLGNNEVHKSNNTENKRYHMASVELQACHGGLRLGSVERAVHTPFDDNHQKEDDSFIQRLSKWHQCLQRVGSKSAVEHRVRRLFDATTPDTSHIHNIHVVSGADNTMLVQDVLCWNKMELASVLSNMGFRRRYGKRFADFVALMHFRLTTCNTRISMAKDDALQSTSNHPSSTGAIGSTTPLIKLSKDATHMDGRFVNFEDTKYVFPNKLMLYIRHLVAVRRLTQSTDPFGQNSR